MKMRVWREQLGMKYMHEKRVVHYSNIYCNRHKQIEVENRENRVHTRVHSKIIDYLLGTRVGVGHNHTRVGIS